MDDFDLITLGIEVKSNHKGEKLLIQLLAVVITFQFDNDSKRPAFFQSDPLCLAGKFVHRDSFHVTLLVSVFNVRQQPG